MNLVLFVDSLRTGGAQRQFSILANGLAERGHVVTFATLHPGGPYWDWLADRGKVSLKALYPARGATMAGRVTQLVDAPRRLRRLVRQTGAEVVYSALHTSNLLAWLAVASQRDATLAWSLRSSHRARLAWKQRPSFALARLVSRRVPLIVANSHAGLIDAGRDGFQARSSSVVVNGIDVTAFAPDPEARQRLRAEWQVPEQSPLVGMVARLDPVKDHPSFLRAAAGVSARAPGARFVCVGGGLPSYRAELERQASELGLADRLLWAGERRDMAAVYNALDILCLASRTEGFPNVVAEAMAAGLPCVATQVGDVAEIIGATGRTVPPGVPEALAVALLEVIELSSASRHQLGWEARSRVSELYSLDAMVLRTEEVLSRLIVDERAAAARLPPRAVGTGSSSW